MDKILIVVNGWNCESFVRSCLQSIVDQTHKSFSVVIIDDASTDNTFVEIQKFSIGNKINGQSCHLSNITNQGTAKCRLMGQLEADKAGIEYDIVVWVDLDDMLLPNALKEVLEAYKDPECWLTYGNFITTNSKEPFNPTALHIDDQIHKTKSYRFDAWKYVHLRTHRKELIYHLTEEDYSSDKFKAYPDINVLYCMLELAGKEHIRVIEKPLYVYRDYHQNVCINRFSYYDRQSEKNLTKTITPKTQLLKL